MEEIDLKDLLTYFIKKIPIVLIVSIILLAIGILYSTLIKKPLYQGTVTLILVQESNGYGQNSGITANDIAVNQKLVSTYSVIAKSDRVLNKVIDALQLEYTVEQLQSKITVASVNDTEIIKIVVSDEDNVLAANIANRIAYVFQGEITDIYNLENVSIIDAAVVKDAPYNVHILKDAIIYLAIGVIASMGVLFVIYYFDTSIKSSEEIEKYLEMPVIGTIPMTRKGKK